MRAIRRLLRVVAFVGTLLVGIMAVALIVSQTPWFKDWLRRYIVRESKQYLNGELTIGSLGGNLLFGIDLANVAVDVSGERVVAVKALTLDYSVIELISTGIVLDEIKIDGPVVHLTRDKDGWNLARLVKRERKEADREGPRRPITLPVIEITEASVSIDDRAPSTSYTLPRRIEGLNVKAGFEYAPVHYTVKFDHLSFRGTSPELTMQQLTGNVAVREDNLYLDGIAIKTSGTALKVEGVVERYLSARILKLGTTGNLSLPEIGRIMPALAGYNLHPVVNVKMNGPIERLALTLDVKSEAGKVRGEVTADLRTPDLAVRGEVDLERLNIAPIVKEPARKTDLTGHAKVDIVIPSQPAGVRIMDRMRGTFAFNGPHAVAEGYEVRNVRVSGSLGPRITLDEARGAAYGGTFTARGFIVTPAPGRQTSFDLRGKADNLDLRSLPAPLQVPLATTLSVADYHVTGEGPIIGGTATLNESVVEGATLAGGTTGEFRLTPGEVSYSARGTVANLDLDRIGGVFEIEALAKPEYDSRINGSFDVAGSVPRTPPGTRRAAAEAPPVIATMTLDASGTLTDSEFLGGRLPELRFEAHLNQDTLTGRADGRFEGFNPARLLGRQELDGTVTGTVNANYAIRNISAPLTPDAVTADGKLAIAQSTIGGLKIESADVEGRYAAQVGDIVKLNVTGPDVKVDASGRIALDRTSSSNVKYHVDAINLTELARLAGQEGVGGTAILDGTITGNAASMRTTGTLDGSNLSYQDTKALDLDSQYTVTVPDLTFANAHVEATTDATFVAVAGMQLNSVKATTTYEQQHLDFTTHIKEKTRELDATGQLILHPDHQEIHLPQLAVRTQGIEWRTAPGNEATVKYGRGRLELENVRLVSGDQALDVSGTLALGSDKPSGAIGVRARNVDIQQLETLLLQNRGFSGKLTADAKITGSTAAPVIDGRFAIEKGAFKSYRYDSLVATLDYRGTRIGIDATLQQSPTESITARGSVPTAVFRASPGGEHAAAAAGEEIDLQIKSNAIGLAVVQGLTDVVTNVVGTLEADVRVTGSAQDPHLDGFIDIKNGGFGVPDLGGTFTGLTTRIDLEADRLRIQQFQLLDHHGEKLTIAGELAVHERQLGTVNISIDSDNFELVDNQLGDIQAQMALKVTGELRRPRIVGSVRLDAGRVEVDQVLQLFYDPYATEALPEVASAERIVEESGSAEEATKAALARAEQSAGAPGAAAKADEPAPVPTGLFQNVELEVHVVLPDNLVLRGKELRPGGPTGTALGDMNITVGGDVWIRKSAGGPVLPTGTVTTVRGTYEFQGRRFDLARGGSIRFIGTPSINPLLDITATRKIPNTGVEAKVRITGTPSAPQLALSSDPPLEESDILSLIVFGRPVNELGTGERSSLAATAGGIATGFLAAPLGESIGKALDLDLFEITTTTDSGELGAGVMLGQQLGDRAFVKLRQQFGERSVTEFLFEYQLTDFLRLQTTASPETSGSANRLTQRRVERAGIDLIFFFSY
jgi:hypothetical protein